MKKKFLVAAITLAFSAFAQAECMTFFFDNGGIMEVFEYCW